MVFMGPNFLSAPLAQTYAAAAPSLLPPSGRFASSPAAVGTAVLSHSFLHIPTDRPPDLPYSFLSTLAVLSFPPFLTQGADLCFVQSKMKVKSA